MDSTGEMVVNPIAQLEWLRENVGGLPDSYVNSADITAAESWAAKHGMRTTLYINSGKKLRSIMNDIASSLFFFPGWDKDGKWTIKYVPYPLVPGNGTSTGAVGDILKGSFQHDLNTSYITTELFLDYMRSSATGGSYLGEIRLADAAKQAELGHNYQRSLILQSCYDPITARLVGEWFLWHLKYGAQECSWSEKLQHSNDYDLGEIVAITDPSGADSSGNGFEQEDFMITEMPVDLAKLQINIRSADVRPWNEDVIGKDAELGDILPWTLI
jgi:hypothetical protein